MKNNEQVNIKKEPLHRLISVFLINTSVGEKNTRKWFYFVKLIQITAKDTHVMIKFKEVNLSCYHEGNWNKRIKHTWKHKWFWRLHFEMLLVMYKHTNQKSSYYSQPLLTLSEERVQDCHWGDTLSKGTNVHTLDTNMYF